MGLQRPAWTVCFFIIWGCIAIASLLMHVAVATIVPAISNLPDNVVKGLLAEFGIGTMFNESISIMISTNKALRMCEPDDLEESGSEGVNEDQEAWCFQYSGKCENQGAFSDSQTISYSNKKVSTTDSMDEILDSYTKSLSKVVKIADDMYLGLAEFQGAAASSKELKTKLEELGEDADGGSCCAQIPLYCTLYDLGKGVNGLSDKAREGVEMISKNDGVLLLDEYATYLNLFHALPYVVVICMVFYTALWYKNGNFCCCENGGFLDFCCIIFPQMLSWLVAFVVMMIFTVLGYFITVVFAATTVEGMPNKPTMQQLVDHIILEYSDFWNLAFAELVSGLEFFRVATTIFVFVALLIFFHSCCFCCCKPYPFEGSKSEG